MYSLDILRNIKILRIPIAQIFAIVHTPVQVKPSLGLQAVSSELLASV